MKTTQVIMSCMCVILVSIGSSGKGLHVRAPFALDEPFDSYGDISWEDEKAHLDNFAIALQRDPNLIGYIIVYAGQRACIGEAQDRARRAKKYVVEIRSIQHNRIRWIDGGHREELMVILQPVPRDSPELIASPTVKLSDVQIIKNCKPKTSKNNNYRSPRPRRKQRQPCS